MSKNDKKTGTKIHIDVTNLVTNKLNISGVQRVDYNIVKYYHGDSTVEFIRYCNRKRQFIVVHTQYITDLLQQIDDIRDNKDGHTVQPTSSRLLTIRQKILNVAERFKLLPLLVRADIVIKNYWGLINTLVKPDSTPEASIFNPKYSKLVLVVGLNFNIVGYASALAEICQQTKVAHFVHDLIPITYPAEVNKFTSQKFTDYMKLLLPLCAYILAVSNYTARDVKRQLAKWKIKPKPTIKLFRSGSELSTLSAKVEERPKGIRHNDFILCVTAISPRKNHLLLIQTYELARQQGRKLPHLYLVGFINDSMVNMVKLVNHSQYLDSSITFLGEVSEATLTWLYSNCQLTVYPSLYEGWGLPVAESLAHGKVTLSSNSTSLPETGEGFSDYFSPYSSQQLLDLLLKFQIKNVRKKREAEIQAGYQPLTWRKAIANYRLDKLVSP